MHVTEVADPSLPENALHRLFESSKSFHLIEALENLIDTARTSDGRSELASKQIILPVLQLCQALSIPSRDCLPLLLLLKLLRNLCAGEIKNQSLFIEQNGVGIVSIIASFVGLAPESDPQIVRLVLQILGNVSLAGDEYQDAIWLKFFPLEFLVISRLRSKETCDPLCMVIHTCSGGDNRRFTNLCKDAGVDIILEIIRTATVVGFGEDWLKMLLSRICLEEHYFLSIFSKLFPMDVAESFEDGNMSRENHFGSEQVFLLSILSEILNERLEDIVVSGSFASCILEQLRNAIGMVDFNKKATLSLPTGNADIDVIGYSLVILRDICACDDTKASSHFKKEDTVDMLVSFGLVQLLISLLRDLEPPATIQKAMNQDKGEGEKTSTPARLRYCPYKGFRRDIVSVLGNCAYRRIHVQDKIREHGGILLLLQQCVTDEDNPFLREWGIWSMRNVLEDHAENQKLVSDLELQGSAQAPEIEKMGLRVEVDSKTRRAKLVNL